MARSTGPILAIGALTMARDVIADGHDVDWRVPIATAAVAVGFSLLERASEDLAVGLAWIALVTVTLSRTDPKKPSTAEALLNYLNGGQSR